MELPIVNHPDYVAKINEDNKFPIKKFGKLANHLKENNIVKKFFVPKPCSFETLNQAHSKDYITKIQNKTLDQLSQKKIGFPLNESVVKRSFVATGGTVLASKLAINFGLACNTAGGSHHANYNEGAGFCIFNDVAVAARYLQKKGYARRILILDLDVHQGNGTADIFKKDNSVFTFSMHCKSNYPAKKAQSDIDVELEDSLEDKEYLATLKKYILYLNEESFDFVFYIAGVDIHCEDKLGKLKISDEGIKTRDQIVINNFYQKRIPLCGVLGGGYNKDFDKLVELHSMLHKSCSEIL
tara:strand:- start:939 stop:1832 length:894 start_codon:yes stop_codon:yes gene_type:complete